ncbi:hypothetical protein LINPERPRIM_LOCUS21978 [Linum perenne]
MYESQPQLVPGIIHGRVPQASII